MNNFKLSSQTLTKLQTIAKWILVYDQIIILGHINPDGDCIGSQQALFNSLQKKFPQKKFFAPFAKTDAYQFLLTDTYQDQIDLTKITNSLFLIVDVASQNRLPASFDLKRNKIVRIDHHPLTETDFADLLWIDVDKGSTAEMIYLFLKIMAYPLDASIARALLTGIITDTGNFTYGNVTPQTFTIASDLLKLGVDLKKLYQCLNLETFSDWKIKSFIMKNYQKKDKVIYFTFKPENAYLFPWLTTNKEIKKFINIFASLAGIEAWCLIVQINRKTEISCSIRSNNKAINQLAAQYGGGGHPLASGIVFPNWKLVDSFLKDLILFINN